MPAPPSRASSTARAVRPVARAPCSPSTGAAPSTPTPKVGAPVSLSGNAESLPLSSPAPPSPSSASLPAASDAPDAPAARPLMGAFVRPAFGGKRAAHPSAKLSPAPAAAAAPPAAPAAVAPSQPQVEPPPLAAPPPPSSPAEAAWPAGFPSLFGRLLCAAPERGAQAAVACVAASFSWSAWQAGGAARFAFDEPSPDDVVLERRKAAFQQLKQPSAPAPTAAATADRRAGPAPPSRLRLVAPPSPPLSR